MLSNSSAMEQPGRENHARMIFRVARAELLWFPEKA